MWFEMRSVGMDFLEDAPRIYVVECDVALPRAEVWDAIADPTTWPHWFPSVRSASYLGESPYGVGTTRISDVGGVRFEETMLAWDEGRRWAYRIDRASFPLAKAQLESSELEDRGSGTRLRWTLATHPGLVLRAAAPFFQGTLQRLLERAVGGLEDYARRRGSGRGEAGTTPTPGDAPQ